MKKTLTVILIILISVTSLYARQSVSVSQGLLFSDVTLSSKVGSRESGISFGAPVLSAVSDNPDDLLGAVRDALFMSKIDLYSMSDIFPKSRFIDFCAGSALSLTRLDLTESGLEELCGVYGVASASLRTKLQFNVGNIGLFASADYPLVTTLMRVDRLSAPLFISVLSPIGRDLGVIYTEIVGAKAGLSIRF